MLKFCTLFNSAYLSRGLAMYHSLQKHSQGFHLYIFAFDDNCLEVLRNMDLKHATIVSLHEFENEALKKVKAERTAGEYCWTCASSTIKYCIEKYQLSHCTYVDADLLFFKDPEVLLAEMGEKSVLITEHRYTPCYDMTEKSGRYCVQFMTFKNTIAGMEVLNWWVDACIEWCFNRFEDGKFGDQKYLDDWQERFSTVHVLKHPGGGVAPWNVQQYTFKDIKKEVTGTINTTGEHFDLVFYHYHDFHYTLNNSYSLSNQSYKLDRNAVKYIYRPYIKALLHAEKAISALSQNVISYEVTNDLQWVRKVAGRKILFFLRGYYKNFYTKTALSYGFLN